MGNLCTDRNLNSFQPDFDGVKRKIGLLNYYNLSANYQLLPHENNPHRNPSSITSLLSHIVRFPNPGDSFFLIEETLNMMRAKIEIQQVEMKSWLEQRLEEVMAPLSKLGEKK